MGEWVGGWVSSSPAPYKNLDVPHTTRELKSGSNSWCVRRPNICTGPASSGRVVWALVFWPDYLQFTDPTIVFPDQSVDTRVLRCAPVRLTKYRCAIGASMWLLYFGSLDRHLGLSRVNHINIAHIVSIVNECEGGLYSKRYEQMELPAKLLDHSSGVKKQH